MKKKQEKNNIKKGNTSLIEGIIGLVLMFVPCFGLPLSILAVISAKKQSKIKITKNSLTGYILGVIGIILNSIFLLFFLFVIFYLLK